MNTTIAGWKILGWLLLGGAALGVGLGLGLGMTEAAADYLKKVGAAGGDVEGGVEGGVEGDAVVAAQRRLKRSQELLLVESAKEDLPDEPSVPAKGRGRRS